jgi:hypothetical protein
MKLQEYKTTATLGGVSFTQSINTANLSNGETTWLFEYWSKAAKAPHRDNHRHRPYLALAQWFIAR